MQVLGHDAETLGEDRGEGSSLTAAYKATAVAWEAVYSGDVYDIPGSGYIPPSVRHPVVEQLGEGERYFGMPVVQRTGGRLP